MGCLLCVDCSILPPHAAMHSSPQITTASTCTHIMSDSSLHIARILGACHCQTVHLSWLQLRCNVHDHRHNYLAISASNYLQSSILILSSSYPQSSPSIYLNSFYPSTIRLTAIDWPYLLSCINQPILPDTIAHALCLALRITYFVLVCRLHLTLQRLTVISYR
jgi:hypothetical protein